MPHYLGQHWERNRENRMASHPLVLLNTEFLLTSRELPCNLAQGWLALPSLPIVPEAQHPHFRLTWGQERRVERKNRKEMQNGVQGMWQMSPQGQAWQEKCSQSE